MRDAWRDYLKHYNHGRGVVLIGHSQGSFVLRQLVAKEIDSKRKVRSKLISAVLLGGNVLVKKGSDVGGDFKHVPACRSRSQTGCVIAFSTFGETPPANAIFGRTNAPGKRGALHQPGGARRRLGEDHADPAERAVRARHHDRRRDRADRRAAAQRVDRLGSVPERLPRPLLDRAPTTRLIISPLRGAPVFHPSPDPELGPAPRGREHRAREPGRAGPPPGRRLAQRSLAPRGA